MEKIRPYLVISSAAVAFLSYPPFPLGPFIFIALVPFFLAIEGLPPMKAFWHGFVWGLVFHLGLIYYIAWVTLPGMLATVGILSLIPSIACFFYVKLLDKNRLLAVFFLPACFLTFNWLLTMSEFNYPWTDFGYSLSYFLPLIQAAEIGGVYFISALILTVNMLIYLSCSEKFAFSSRSRTFLRCGSVFIIICLFVYGTVRLKDSDIPAGNKSLTVGLIQGNMTKDVKWKPAYLQMNFDRYFELSRKAVEDGAEFLVWPETAIPAYLLREKESLKTVKQLIDSLDAPLLTGIPHYETVAPKEYIFFNSAVLIKPNSYDFKLYSKIHLVPVSERIPFSERFRTLREIRLGQADFSSGKDLTIFEIDSCFFAGVICFESAFPGFCRQFAQKGAQFLVIITNDMWFGRTSLFEQHAQMAVFRAVENRIPVVRAANTGISMSVDKWGRILKKSEIFAQDDIVTEIHPENSKSIYGKRGDVIPKIALILTVASLIVALCGHSHYNE